MEKISHNDLLYSLHLAPAARICVTCLEGLGGIKATNRCKRKGITR